VVGPLMIRPMCLLVARHSAPWKQWRTRPTNCSQGRPSHPSRTAPST
jgi:hypothetical protein